MKSFALFEEVIRRYAQEGAPPLDPNQIQVGQSVYDSKGDEFLVLEDPEGTTNKVLTPAGQTTAPVPGEVQTVEDTELASTYTVQPAMALQANGMRVGGYYDEDNPSYDDPPSETDHTRAPDFMTFGPQTNGGFKTEDGDVSRYDHTTHSPGSHTKAPETSGPINPDEKSPSSEKPETSYLMRGAALQMDISGLAPYRETGSPLESGPGWGKEEDALRLGESGYADIMNDIRAMTEAGYSTVDVLLNIGELYPRDIGERVLSEARKRGVL